MVEAVFGERLLIINKKIIFRSDAWVAVSRNLGIYEIVRGYKGRRTEDRRRVRKWQRVLRIQFPGETPENFSGFRCVDRLDLAERKE